MKTCTKCKTGYPATEEHFYIEKHNKDGLHSWCRKCCAAYRKKHNQQHQDKKRDYNKEYRTTINGYLREVYNHMKQRCNASKNPKNKGYVKKGIKCLFTSDELVNYVINVLKVDPRGLQIDRIDNGGHYEKGNIRFVTAKENCANRG